MVVVLSLLIGGILMILFEKIYKPKNKKLNFKSYLIIGLFQVFSMIPGVSRAFATIFGAMLVGMNRKEATEFSFFLAVPTMLAATSLDLLRTDLNKWANLDFLVLLIGFLGSFITAYIVIKWLIKFVQTNNFIIFGVYRIILAVVFLFLIGRYL